MARSRRDHPGAQHLISTRDPRGRSNELGGIINIRPRRAGTCKALATRVTRDAHIYLYKAGQATTCTYSEMHAVT